MKLITGAFILNEGTCILSAGGVACWPPPNESGVNWKLLWIFVLVGSILARLVELGVKVWVEKSEDDEAGGVVVVGGFWLKNEKELLEGFWAAPNGSEVFEVPNIGVVAAGFEASVPNIL